MKTRAELMQTSRGYWQARALLTAVELGVFEALGRRRLTVGTVAKRVGTDPRATGMLLDALVGLGILSKAGSTYAIRREMRSLLTSGDDSALDMLRHHARLWSSWNQLTDCVREGRPARGREGFRDGEAAAHAFTQAMRAGARLLAPLVAKEISLRGRSRLLDLGGGPGLYAAAFARSNPRLEVVIVDLPDVCHVGETIVGRERDVADRIAYHAADLDSDPLPGGADAAFLSHVIHSQTPEQVRTFFVKVRKALLPGGVLVVRDFFTSPDRTMPPPNSLFGLNMLVNTEGGRAYSSEETRSWARKAGFSPVSFRRSKALPDTAYILARIPA